MHVYAYTVEYGTLTSVFHSPWSMSVANLHCFFSSHAGSLVKTAIILNLSRDRETWLIMRVAT